MIRPININLNAAHPELPLVEATTFTGAPSSVFIRGVPKAVGNWSITAVSVAVTYPDNTTTARAAVESAEGVWVATIPGTATSGRTAAGFKIMADGIDENGDAVTGYVLGFADFSVLSFTPVPAPGGTFYLLRYFDQAPATPKEGDVAVVDGLLKMYNGTAWRGFGDGPGFSTDDPQMDGSASPGSAATAARSDHVHPTDTSRAADDAVVKLTGDQTIAGNKTFQDTTLFQNEVLVGSGDLVVGTVGVDNTNFYTNGIRTYGHPAPIQYPAYNGLGKDFFALIQHIAPDYDGETSHTYAIDELRSYQGAVYRCVTAHTATSWVAAYWTLATVEDVLAVLRMEMAEKVNGPLSYSNGDLASFDSSGNLEDSGIDKVSVVVRDELAYDLVTKTISNGAVSIDDRAINAVAVSSSLASLTVNFPTATSGKARDFGLRLTVASGITTAPELALPQGVTCENADGEAPEIGADGAATILYFTETASGVFLVKGEVVTAIS